jgi:hypothetical protein
MYTVHLSMHAIIAGNSADSNYEKSFKRRPIWQEAFFLALQEKDGDRILELTHMAGGTTKITKRH